VGDDQLADIPSTIEVARVWAFDAVRHLSFRGRYLGWLAVPDPWISWFACAMLCGLKLIRKHKPRVLWSTYPIATAHLIALALHRLTGIPWIADFRDPMIEIDPVTNERWPKDPKIWRAREWIERYTVSSCARAVFVTNGAVQIYAQRYSEVPASRWALIANGYSEDSFTAAEAIRNGNRPQQSKIVLLHSGVLYPSPDRNPGEFFAALAELRKSGKISSKTLQIILRASSSEDLYRKLVLEHRIEDIVTLEPPIAHNQALAEMLSVDGLLVFQGHDSNPAIPAKLYEYIRARRPIFALVDDRGDTAALLRQAKLGTLVPLDSSDRIAAGLLDFLEQVRSGVAPVASDQEIERHGRRKKAAELAYLFDEIISEREHNFGRSDYH
jgi:glycosyltransferase involved in cell wall biosynthesis